MARCKKDWDDPKIKDEIAEDMKVGTAVGASGTPTFFINGRQLVGAQPADAFQKIIDDEIKKADELLKKGTPLKDVYTQADRDRGRGARRRPPRRARRTRAASST